MMRCCKWLCEEEEPTVSGLLRKGTKQESEDVVKACKTIRPVERWERQWLFTVCHFARIYTCKNQQKALFNPP